MGQGKEIFEGFVNYIFPTEEIKEVLKDRLEHCMNCPIRDGKVCSKQKKAPAIKDFIYKGESRIEGKLYKGCGCQIYLKGSSPSSHCPIGNF